MTAYCPASWGDTGCDLPKVHDGPHEHLTNQFDDDGVLVGAVSAAPTEADDVYCVFCYRGLVTKFSCPLCFGVAL